MPYSKLKVAIAKVLQDEGYIASWREEGEAREQDQAAVRALRGPGEDHQDPHENADDPGASAPQRPPLPPGLGTAPP